MDDYDSELRVDDHEVEDGWKNDDVGEVSLGEIPEELWSDCPIDRQPEAPEPWIDRLADMVELGRLYGMNVLEEVTAEWSILQRSCLRRLETQRLHFQGWDFIQEMAETIKASCKRILIFGTPQ